MNEINILMTCSWIFNVPQDGTTKDDIHEVHSAYINHTDALEAAKFYKYDDETSGLHNTRYWVIVVPVEDKAPISE